MREEEREKIGHTITIGREVMLTHNSKQLAACHYSVPFECGCITNSYFSSPFTTLQDAVKTGRCTLVPNAVVAHINREKGENRAAGVTYVDRISHQTKEVKAKTVILCAQALESTRILLNSTTREGSTGLGNSSGLLGRGLMDHSTGGGATGELPGFEERPSMNGPHRSNGIYVIRFRNLLSGPQHKRFIRGYGYQGGAGPQFDFGAAGF